MSNRIKLLLVKYKQLIFYGIFGLGATLINILSFYLFRQIIGTVMIVSNIFAWVFAFIFAFVTNKLLVFESRDWKSQTAIKEMANFFITRLMTLALDTFCMWLMIDVLNINDLASKIAVNILVIAVNYIASKFWVFRKSD